MWTQRQSLFCIRTQYIIKSSLLHGAQPQYEYELVEDKRWWRHWNSSFNYSDYVEFPMKLVILQTDHCNTRYWIDDHVFMMRVKKSDWFRRNQTFSTLILVFLIVFLCNLKIKNQLAKLNCLFHQIHTTNCYCRHFNKKQISIYAKISHRLFLQIFNIW